MDLVHGSVEYIALANVAILYVKDNYYAGFFSLIIMLLAGSNNRLSALPQLLNSTVVPLFLLQ